MLTAYPNEFPIVEGTFDSLWYDSITHDITPLDSLTILDYYGEWNNLPMVALHGMYQVVQGITFRKAHLNALLFEGRFNILKDCRMEGTMEDLVKTSVETRDGLILNCDFTQFGGEAIDVFGAENFHVVGCHFHDEFTEYNPRSSINVM